MRQELDAAFIQPIEHRPTSRPIEVEPKQIPQINLSVSDTNCLVAEIEDACKKWGFFHVINHGVSLELRKRVEDVARKFFDQSLEEKRKVKRDEANSVGYNDGEHTKNVRDWKQVFNFLVEDSAVIPASHEVDDEELRVLTNQWPQCPSGFREACKGYGREVEKLAFKLLELISLSLGLHATCLNGYFEGQLSFLRLNYYPPCPFPELALGVGRHKDSDALTVLAQNDVGGLQVKRKSDGEWISVKPIPNAFIINIGDILQVWSNDRYRSVEHRVVVNSKKERFSVPFFFFPAHNVTVKPLKEFLNDDNPTKYKGYKVGKFYVTRNRSDYKKLAVDSIQIDHFKKI